MDNKIYTEEEKKTISHLKANYEMLNRSKEEAKMRGKQKSVEQIQNALDDVIVQLDAIDPSIVKSLSKEVSDGFNNEIIASNDTFNLYKEMGLEGADIINETKPSSINFDEIERNITSSRDYEFNNIDMSVAYDIVSLPSKGECYKNKFDRVPVSYLTAYDENFITSPSLYKDGVVIDYLLKHKVMNKNINLDELCTGDVDAIILFLRATSYGAEFPIMAVDPETNQEIESVVDLTTLKMKDFKLVGDENGWFEYILPMSKDVVKFRFLTRKDEKILKHLSTIEDYGVKANHIRKTVREMINIIKKDDVLNGKEKQQYIDSLSKYEGWCQRLNEKESLSYNRAITNRLELSVMSINGETDRGYISKYVKNMVARDALMLRRYILDNEPGVDFEIEVERPESLGGGSFKTFLEWNDSVFLNIAR